jgi:acyl-CoA synthetase (AMP-forming)/AMP-acid ligase II/thioesterase domain-containing protein
MTLKTLGDLLRSAAAKQPQHGLQIYLPGNLTRVGRSITYPELLDTAMKNAEKLRLQGLKFKSIVLLYVTNHLDNLEWFWSIVQAGCVPCICTPLPRDTEQREKHLAHLKSMLGNPLLLTRKQHLRETPELHVFDQACTLESLESVTVSPDDIVVDDSQAIAEDDTAALMLTSGSSGNAKAVQLRHKQMLYAVEGKSIAHRTTTSDTFLNWVGIDHVANLTEIHLHAMQSAANQIHVHADDLLANPLSFLDLVDKHRVAHSFGPNFFLASLYQALQQVHPLEGDHRPDLSCFRALTTGGEANVVKMCNALVSLLKSYGAPESVVRPMYGLTETCAGVIVSQRFPQHDLAHQYEFAAVGTCVPGVKMRVVTDDGQEAKDGEQGNLEVCGSSVFRAYYNNPVATNDAFTSDGWFITGDRAKIDSMGQLVLTGRAKETIIINGVKYIPTEMETAINEARIPGVSPGFTAVFPHRPAQSNTEVICVVYLPTYEPSDITIRLRVSDAINKISILHTGTRPCAIIPLNSGFLERSSIGKLSRAKIRQAFERGDYKELQEDHEHRIATHKLENYEPPVGELENAIQKTIERLLELPENELGVHDNIFDFGISSVEMIRLLRSIEKEVQLNKPITVETIMGNPTIRGLHEGIIESEKPHVYEPVVVLQSKGSQQPLWLIHPGDGEILVYLQLARQFTERPVYAIRSRGLNEEEEFFHSLDESVTIYHSAIKKMQPSGPYAIVGYSYGVVNAFEIARRMENDGDEIRFLGLVDLPPSLDQFEIFNWSGVLLNLSFFLDLIDEKYATSLMEKMKKASSRGQVLNEILALANPERLDELGMNKGLLNRRVDLVWNVLQTAVKQFIPSGKVSNMEIFYAAPLLQFNLTIDEWHQRYMRQWDKYCNRSPRYHQVDGSHHTIFNPENVTSVFQKLQHVLWECGI